LARQKKILEKLDSLNLPDSHEDAIFALANTYYLHGLYSTAALVWKRALVRYPIGPTSNSARFQLGGMLPSDGGKPALSIRFKKPGVLDRNKWQNASRTHANKLDDAAAEFEIVVHNLQAKRGDRRFA